MPKRDDIHKILIIGSGPIVIGQACEFDYSGTQACRALRAEGYATVLVNSNPATIMTDPELADATYVEPLLPEYVEKIIDKERPDALLPTMGGQTGLNVTAELHRWGVLDHYNVELIGANYEAIHKAEGREAFKTAMEKIGLELPRGGIARNPEEAEELMGQMRFPIIIRPAFTLGGTGGSIAYNVKEYRDQMQWGLSMSPISEVLVEQSVIGWKEYELEVMRDLKDNVVVICSIENVDPMGIHTGDSFTVAPAQTLTDKEYQVMRDAAVKIIREIGVDTGGSNIQFAVHPETGRMLVIEMNPRVSRSSALASKATGFPIAKIAAKLAVGFTLDEIPNDITRKTPASFEPTIDYVVVKAPRWDFGKFAGADAQLGTQMKSVGEAMAIGRTFKEALGKSLRSLEIGRFGLEDTEALFPKGNGTVENYLHVGDILERLRANLRFAGAKRLFWIGSALRAGVQVEEVSKLTGIDPWFLRHMAEIVEMERRFKTQALTPAALDREAWIEVKSAGFSDRQLADLWSVTEGEVRHHRLAAGVRPVFKTVDTCAAEFESSTPYLYSTYEEENESVSDDVRKVVILGGGPNRIGQGIEFDYCCVHAVMALQEMSIQAIMINCNPETVSTDYDVADKLYFEPLTLEDVLHVLELEQPEGVVVQFGGQTPLKLAIPLMMAGYNILGTSPESIDLAEDRGRFGRMLREMEIRQPDNGTARSVDQALNVCKRIGFPVLLRPSYVLGGRAMEIAYDESSIRAYMGRAVVASEEHPVLIDKFLEDAFEFDVDAVCDGDEVFIGGIMQHIEEAGVHSGDSSCVMPPYWLSDEHRRELNDQTRKLAMTLNVRGLANVQFAMKDDDIYVLEVNPRASRTVPYVSKSIGIPLAKVATRVMMGQKLKDIVPESVRQSLPGLNHITVKTPVFPFEKFPGARPFLGPEMKSTGEVMGLGRNFGRAFAKAQFAAGNRLPLEGRVFISVNDNDKAKAVPLAKAFTEMGFKLVATSGTKAHLCGQGLEVEQVFKVKEGRPNVADQIINGEINLVVNTPLGKGSRYDEYAISRTALQYRVPCLTTLSASWAAVDAIKALRGAGIVVRPLQEYHPPK